MHKKKNIQIIPPPDLNCLISVICSIIIFAVGKFGCTTAMGSATSEGDWPTYRADITRSGATDEKIAAELFLQWHVSSGAPKPAWPPPAEEIPRAHSDNAFYVTAAGGIAYFGSSIDNKVYALDIAEGKIRWSFYTQGPVRFAPTIYNGRVYFGSDDGYVYCLDAKDGSLIWKYRPGPNGDKAIGNGRMISVWPIRTSVLVDRDQVLFCAGVFPFEGIYVCAVSAENGSVIWKNDTIGDRPHDLPYGGISPQGYLIASEDVLYVPSGRAMPGAFDRKDGKLLFYALPPGKSGGTWALLDNDRIIAGVDVSGSPQKVAYDAKTGKHQGDAFAWFPGIDMVITKNTSYILTDTGICAIDRAVYAQATQAASEYDKLSDKLAGLRKKLETADETTKQQISQQIDAMTGTIDDLGAKAQRLKKSCVLWKNPRRDLYSLILAGSTLFAGGEGVVLGIDAGTGKELWSRDIVGKAVGLTPTDGRLIVSSDEGPVYCFGKGKVAAPKEIKTITQRPYPNDELTEIYQTAAERIIEIGGVSKGYCLVLDSNIGRLAYELALRSDLKIIGLEKDREKLKIAREHLGAAGLLGSRVVVEPWDIEDLPSYFANLIVSDDMLSSGHIIISMEQRNHLLRPYGGVILTCSQSSQSDWVWDKFVRGELQGAGSWMGLYANTQNTACSEDKLVTGPFGVLWYGQPGPQRMVERHGRATAPLSINGRLFIQGEDVIMAYDAYNGAFLWDRDIPGAVRTRADVDGGNIIATENALYVAAGEKCYRIDQATGEVVRTYKLPAPTDDSTRRWGYVGCSGNTLIATAAFPLEQEYAATWKDFAATGRWKELDEMPEQTRRMIENDQEKMSTYERYKKAYPAPDENALRDFQRSGAHWRIIDDFPSWNSQRTPKGALTNRLMDGDSVFAVDTETGQQLWRYDGPRIPNISVTIADGRVFFVESKVSTQHRNDAGAYKKDLLEKGIYIETKREEAVLADKDADVRLVVALDIATGKPIWKKPLDLTGCGGDKMGTAYKDGILLFFGNFSNHDTEFFKKGELAWRRITAVSGQTGEVIWSKPLNYLRRPLIIGDKVIIEPRACELRTGEIVKRIHPITGQPTEWEFLRPGHCCSITSASASTLFYRSYFSAIYDFANDKGISLFGGIRPGCWLNMISANGLMLMPEASSGCTCSFPLRCSLALAPKPKKVTDNWTVFVTHGDMTPARHFAVNFGAPGDMKDAQGTLWFGYPRPKTVSNIGYGSYEVKFSLKEELIDGMGSFCKDFDGVQIEGSDKPWLFTCGYQGLRRCEVPLIDPTKNQKPASYTVRLGFNAMPGDKPGRRVFDIVLQGKTVLKEFDILRSAGKTNKALIREFENIPVENSLILELVPEAKNPQLDQAPIISFIEVIREATPLNLVVE